jgi:very-short-patch-repair endonuclease
MLRESNVSAPWGGKIGLTVLSEVDALIADLGRERHWVLGRSELRAKGVSEKAIRTRLDDGRLRRLHRGVFAVGPGPVSQRGRGRAATLAARPPLCLRHPHATALWDLAKAPRGPIHVVTDRWLPDRAGIHFHSAVLSAEDVTTQDAIPVTSLARTFLDAAADLSELQLRRTWERAEHLQILNLIPIYDLLERCAGHRGSARLRALLAYDPTAAGAAASELERLYLDLLRAARIETPHVNVLVDGHLVDCYWPKYDLVVELDSYELHGDREAFERDRAKLADLKAAGHQAVQFTHRQVTRAPEWVVTRTRGLMVRDAESAAAL